MRRIHFAVWLDGASRPRAGTFITLFFLEAWCRGTLLTVVPLQAHTLLGNARDVSVLYFAVSVCGLASTLVIPMLVHTIRRRWAFTVGGGLLVGAVAAYATGNEILFAIGLGAQVIATAFFEIVLNLYVLDHVPRTEIKKFEPKRLLFAATPFTVGPWLGVWLAEEAGPVATYTLVASITLAMLGYFWFLRITDDPAVSSPLRPPPNPIRYLPRFFAQGRLRLAWGLAIGRTAWWVMYFVYAPIFLTGSGYSAETTGLVISLSVLPMFLAPVWGAIGRRHGVRFLLTLGFAASGLLTMTVGFSDGIPVLGLVLIAASAFAATLVDGAGNVPFLRAVHPFERAEMTSVFVTFRQTAQLLTPGIFAVVLSVFALPAVFVTGGLVSLAMSRLARYLPKKL